MGMYTLLQFGADLKKDTPYEVVNILWYMLGKLEPTPPLPDHPLFQTDRWDYILCIGDSGYFDEETKHSFNAKVDGGMHLSVTSNLKNYNQEIQHFIDWIMPYVDAEEGQLLGSYRYEESRQATEIRYAAPQVSS